MKSVDVDVKKLREAMERLRNDLNQEHMFVAGVKRDIGITLDSLEALLEDVQPFTRSAIGLQAYMGSLLTNWQENMHIKISKDQCSKLARWREQQ